MPPPVTSHLPALQALLVPQEVPSLTAVFEHCPLAPHTSLVQGFWSSQLLAVQLGGAVSHLPALQALLVPQEVPSLRAVFEHCPLAPHTSLVQGFWSSQLAAEQPPAPALTHAPALQVLLVPQVVPSATAELTHFPLPPQMSFVHVFASSQLAGEHVGPCWPASLQGYSNRHGRVFAGALIGLVPAVVTRSNFVTEGDDFTGLASAATMTKSFAPALAEST